MKLFESTKNTRAILPDSLRFIRSDVPTKITAEELQWLKENDMLTIVDLREEHERQQKPCPLAGEAGFAYWCMPVSGGNAVPATPEDVPLSYISMVDGQMDQIMDTLCKAKSNVLYFCNAGKDRTGVVSAILLHRLGCSDEYIIADYMESADNLREMLQAFAESSPEIDIAVITPQTAYMEQFLIWLKSR